MRKQRSLMRLSLVFVLAVLTLLQSIAYGESIKGLDTLGLAKTKKEYLRNELDNNSAVGYLDSTFGNPYPNLKFLLDSGKVTHVRAHLIDGTCIRNNSCPPGAPKYKDLKTLKQRAKKLSDFAAKYPHIKWYVSPFLEHDCKDKKLVEKWYGTILAVNPTLKHVCSAFTGYCPTGVFIEKHGNNKQAAIVSNDGESLFDADFSYRDSGSLITFGWIPQFNGRVSGEKGKPPMPKLRVNWPTRDDIRQSVRLLRPVEPKPQVTSCKDITRPELSKTNAEYYGQGVDDGRGNKPLLITKRRYSKINIHKVTGEKVGYLSYYGTYSGGGYRHYMGKIGSNQTPVKLMDDLGREWGVARVSGECWYFNAIRRLGYYR